MAPKTVISGKVEYLECPCADTIAPGRRVNPNPNGVTLAGSSDAGKVFAVEGTKFDAQKNLAGRDVPYENGDTILIAFAHPGSRILAYLNAGQNASKGTLLYPSANGTLATTGSGEPVGIALEAKSAGASPEPIQILVL